MGTKANEELLAVEIAWFWHFLCFPHKEGAGADASSDEQKDGDGSEENKDGDAEMKDAEMSGEDAGAAAALALLGGGSSKQPPPPKKKKSKGDDAFIWHPKRFTMEMAM